MEACHTLRIAHRDIKLSNILLDSCTPPHVKLTDFGCAKRWPGTTNDPHMRTFIGEWLSSRAAAAASAGAAHGQHDARTVLVVVPAAIGAAVAAPE